VEVPILRRADDVLLLPTYTGARAVSVRMLTRVFDTSPSEGLSRLVLIALADYADDDGHCWPAIASIARKARCAESTVHRSLKKLVAAGEIEIDSGAGMNGVHRYRLVAAAGEQLKLGVPTSEGSHVGTGARLTPKPSVPRSSSTSSGTDVAGYQSGRGARLTPPSVGAETKAQADEAKALWWNERERHRKKSGEAFARFMDRKALGNLVLSLGRALKLGTWDDVTTALKVHAADPKSNPWYLDEWTNEQAGLRAEAEHNKRKMMDRERDEHHWNMERPMKAIGDLVGAATAHVRLDS